MDYVPTIFALLCGAAGWFYFLHAGHAAHLRPIEAERDNALRIRLRRTGGLLMFALAVAFYVGFTVADRRGNAMIVLVCLVLIVLLLPVILFLAWIDMRLTRKMRESLKKKS